MVEFKKQQALKHPFFDLYHYHAVMGDGLCADYRRVKPAKVPILIVYALVNRPSILDLSPQRSFINSLCNAGYNVYLMDWGYPNQSAAKLTLRDYALDFIDDAVESILKDTHNTQINLVGVCQGGVFSLCYAAWRPQRVAKLIPIVTPIDFHTKDNLITPQVNRSLAQQWVDELGNLPGSTLHWFLTMLKPGHTLLNKFNRFLAIKDNTEEVTITLKMEQWIHDTPDHPGQVLIDFINDFYINNSFMKTDYKIGGIAIRWSSLVMPILNVYALDDHLVPPSAAKALGQVLDSTGSYEELGVQTGHIGLFVSRKSALTTPALIIDWLLKYS